MILNDVVREEGFCVSDGLVLTKPLLLEAEELLPVPASTCFWPHDPVCREGHRFSRRQSKMLTDCRADRIDETDTAPAVLEGMLMLPLLTGEGGGVDLVIHDVDTAVLRKMDPEWLLDLQDKILRRFSRIRHIYTDPVTGLYNQRALDLLLSAESRWKSLFLVATVSGARTIAGGFQKKSQLVSRFRTLSAEPLFYLGQGLFGLVSCDDERGACLGFAHRLISRLKRDGLRRVHVGFSPLVGELSPEEMLSNCRLILSEAERRGPYSLCDDAFLNRKEQHPFALPPARILRNVQKKWRGLDRFGLLLIVFSGDSAGDDGSECEECPDLTSILPADSSSVAISAHRQLLLLPDYTAERMKKQVRQLARNIEHSAGMCPAMGYCHWPSVGLSKIDCIRSCRKAILHGSFYGDGAVVEFDALSFNVSGDLYFDEGDYKQAIREYRAGLSMNSGDINLLNSLGVALAEVNRHREAVAYFSQVLDAASDNYMALINKGMSCRILGQNEDAVACFERGLRCREHGEQASIELYLQLGKLYCMREEFEKAVDLFREWRRLKGEPGEFIFFRLMGEACMGAGKNREAVKALQRSLRIYPQNADSQSMLGLLYVLEGQGSEVGLSLCDRAVVADSADSRHLYRRGAALYHLGRFAEALDDVRSSLKMKRNYEQALLLRGILYEELGSLRRARRSFQRIVSMETAAESRKEKASAGLNRIAART